MKFPLLAVVLTASLLGSFARADNTTVSNVPPDYTGYVSPYEFSSNITNSTVTSYFQQSPRSMPQLWSKVPYADWYNFTYIKSLHTTWGPGYTPFYAPPGILAHTQDLDWLTLRLFAAANVLRGTCEYAHHHMANWIVPDANPWKRAGYTPGAGIDCSDFTHFAYSYGLGISLDAGTAVQSQTTTAYLWQGAGNNALVNTQRILDVQNGYTKDYKTLVASLQPGDLLFIRGDPGFDKPITHVIMFLGNYATDINHQDPYLIMDSHGAVVTDSNGVTIPGGPQIRPFREDSYYYNCFDHVIRVFPFTITPSTHPSITVAPTPVAASAGTTARFSVTASGQAPLHYAWQFNGVNLANGKGIAGAATTKLTLSKISAASAGQYTVTITNTVGQITSFPVALRVEHTSGNYTQN